MCVSFCTCTFVYVLGPVLFCMQVLDLKQAKFNDTCCWLTLVALLIDLFC